MSKNLIRLRKGKLAENTGFEPYAFLICTGRSAIELILQNYKNCISKYLEMWRITDSNR